jgi:hypothetical protein
MSPGDKDARDRKSGAAARAERLAAELKANLKKRKEQARARQRSGLGQERPSLPASDEPET